MRCAVGEAVDILLAAAERGVDPGAADVVSPRVMQDQPGVQSGERGLQAGMDQRRSLYDDDVKSLFGISVQKLAIVPTPWSRCRPPNAG
jgi:hypothetical protein